MTLHNNKKGKSAKHKVPTELVDELFDSLVNGERDIDDLDADETIDMLNKLQPYTPNVKTSSDNNKIYAYSLINLREEYDKKRITTSVIGFLFRMADEYGVPDGSYVDHLEELNKDEITKEYIESNIINGNVVLKKEVPAGVSGGENYVSDESIANKFKRLIIREFLMDMFEYNPDYHVRTAYQKNKNDPERNKVRDHGKHMKPYRKGKKVSKVNEMEREYNRIVDHIPSADMFHRLTYYMDSCHDPIRIAVRDLYAEKPDLEYSLIIYDQFDNREDYQRFVDKNENSVIADIREIKQNNWTLQMMFSENRERQLYYNKNTRILQEIMDQHESGKRLGKDMMEKRKYRKKQQNIDECGPDDEKFTKEYKKEQSKTLRKSGLVEMSKRERQQYDIEQKYLNKYDRPSPMLDDKEFEDAIEVQTWTNDTKNRKLKPSSFFTQAEKLKDEQVGQVGLS